MGLLGRKAEGVSPPDIRPTGGVKRSASDAREQDRIQYISGGGTADTWPDAWPPGESRGPRRTSPPPLGHTPNRWVRSGSGEAGREKYRFDKTTFIYTFY